MVPAGGLRRFLAEGAVRRSLSDRPDPRGYHGNADRLEEYGRHQSPCQPVRRLNVGLVDSRDERVHIRRK